MTEPAGLSSWDPTEYGFSFRLDVPNRVQRGWERAPKSPHAARYRGRKVWKRPELRTPAPQEEFANPHINGGSCALEEVSTNTPRAVKKLRLKDVLGDQEDAATTKRVRYVTTLRDGNQGTPRRKYALAQGNPDLAEGLTSVLDLGVERTVLGDQWGVSKGSAVKDTQESMDSPKSEPEDIVPWVAAEPLTDRIQHEDISMAPSMEQGDAAQEVQEPCTEATALGEGTGPHAVEGLSVDGMSDTTEGHLSREVKALEADTAATVYRGLSESHAHEEPWVTATQEDEPTEMVESTEEKASGFPSPYNRTKCSFDVHIPTQARHPITPASASPPERSSTSEYISMAERTRDAPELLNIDTLQIGMTLLRRESLRRKESPGRKVTRDGRSPQERQLKKRDTLQEREILQRFGEAISPSRKSGIGAVAGLASPQLSNHVTKRCEEDRSALIAPEPAAERDLHIDLVKEEAGLGTIVIRPAVREIEACEDISSITRSSVSVARLTEVPLATHDVQHASGSIPKAEVADTWQSLAAVCENANLPVRKTRFDGRLSDDTTILKDFLDRAQARKAAKNTHEVPKSLQGSLRRSPRKTLQPRIDNASSPHKLGELMPKRVATRPSTPAERSKMDLCVVDDVAEPATESASCRRSARTRLQAPSKTPPGAPSFIPVRRADGTDPVVLQKSQAQELAILTRANTRRNKGQSKPPLLALQDFSGENYDPLIPAKQRTEHAKVVAWADTLAEESNPAVEEVEDQRRKIRRLRGLGARNGTSAAKRKPGIVPSSNGTPAPKRRGKIL
ncbi:MAG: hypothetical protein Q9217_005545 [Psora testacea]